MTLNLNFETRFEIRSSFSAYITRFVLKLLISHLFPVPHCKFENSQIAVRSFFFEFEIFDVRFEISVLKDIKMVGVVTALSKKW